MKKKTNLDGTKDARTIAKLEHTLTKKVDSNEMAAILMRSIGICHHLKNTLTLDSHKCWII